jgi:CheY-like chemotaxis protein
MWSTGRVARDHGCLSGVRVLVVDDDEDVRDALLSILRLFGADGDAVDCADQARALLDEQRFDVLLSDIEMPDEDGYALIRSVRGSCRAQRIAAAAVTACASGAERRAALEAGFDRVVGKPPEVDALIDAVRELARGAGREPGRGSGRGA